MNKSSRRNFLKTTSIVSAGISMIGTSAFASSGKYAKEGDKAVGIVGMDTSHSPALAKAFNNSANGYRVTTAFTTVSHDLPSSADRVEKFTQQISDMGVEIVPTLEMLLSKVDYVLLCTVDGRRHLEQAEIIFKAKKRVFIDKPMAASLQDVVEIFKLSKKYDVPTFSSSAVRFMQRAQEIRNGSIGLIQGAETYAPIKYEPTHPELYWYGIHGIELLFTLMKSGCIRVKRFTTEKYDMVTGDWGEGRIGTFRGLKGEVHDYGGHAFGDKGISDLGKFKDYELMFQAILHYFNTGEMPVHEQETVEIFAFMEAAQESERQGGDWVAIKDVLAQVGYKK